MFKELTSSETLINIALKDEKIDVIYTNWQNKINNIMERCFKKK